MVADITNKITFDFYTQVEDAIVDSIRSTVELQLNIWPSHPFPTYETVRTHFIYLRLIE